MIRNPETTYCQKDILESQRIVFDGHNHKIFLVLHEIVDQHKIKKSAKYYAFSIMSMTCFSNYKTLKEKPIQKYLVFCGGSFYWPQ